jgi:hypothetical protein
MIRKQIYLTEEINQKLLKLAEDRGVPQAELIREGLEQYLTSVNNQEELWEQLKTKIAASNYHDLQWNRTALYEDRMDPKRGSADE